MTKRQKIKLDTEEQATLEAFEEALEKGKIKSFPHMKEEIERASILPPLKICGEPSAFPKGVKKIYNFLICNANLVLSYI